MPVYHWAQNFTVSDDDLEFLSGLLLEREIPLRTDELAQALIERKLADENAALEERYKNVRFYNPSETYEPNEKILFPALSYASATVQGQREGSNPAYGSYDVINVRFDGDERERSFAANLKAQHKLSDDSSANTTAPWAVTLTTDDIMTNAREEILAKVTVALGRSEDLISVGGQWFLRSLMLDVNVGHLNLAEAVLDMMMGGPLRTDEILEQIGGLGSAAKLLQVFCLNDALNHDNRFDEVGPVDTILWYLRRQEPAEVVNTPPMIAYTAIDYDPALLTPEMEALEVEIDDEWSDLIDDEDRSPADQVEITLNYPHRRAGTLPLNAKMREVFPKARRTPQIYVTLVDGQDQEEYVGWVVRNSRYVYGLREMYQKHKIPVGARVMVKRAAEPGKIIIDFQSYKPRTEWIRIITPKDGQIAFEDQKRAIGATYDEQMLLGADDLTAVDALFTANSRRSITLLAKTVLNELSRSAPQNPVHAKTLYSAMNVLRRLPPGPLFAAMITSPDFEYVGNNYWKLSGS